jgi:hypothetical protein
MYVACYGVSGIFGVYDGGILEVLRAPTETHVDCTHYNHVGEVAA